MVSMNGSHVVKGELAIDTGEMEHLFSKENEKEEEEGVVLSMLSPPPPPFIGDMLHVTPFFFCYAMLRCAILRVL